MYSKILVLGTEESRCVTAEESFAAMHRHHQAPKITIALPSCLSVFINSHRKFLQHRYTWVKTFQTVDVTTANIVTDSISANEDFQQLLILALQTTSPHDLQSQYTSSTTIATYHQPWDILHSCAAFSNVQDITDAAHATIFLPLQSSAQIHESSIHPP